MSISDGYEHMKSIKNMFQLIINLAAIIYELLLILSIVCGLAAEKLNTDTLCPHFIIAWGKSINRFMDFPYPISLPLFFFNRVWSFMFRNRIKSIFILL